MKLAHPIIDYNRQIEDSEIFIVCGSAQVSILCKGLQGSSKEEGLIVCTIVIVPSFSGANLPYTPS
jgi:hypothetical protein